MISWIISWIILWIILWGIRHCFKNHCLPLLSTPILTKSMPTHPGTDTGISVSLQLARTNIPHIPDELVFWKNRRVFGHVKQAILGTSTPARQEHPMGEARKDA